LGLQQQRPECEGFLQPCAAFPRVPQYNFGTSFGGPIRKDKTFFFGDYEGSREAANVVITGNTPLPAWRSGDFSVLFTNIIDPLTGALFPGNRIPANRINPVSQKTQDFFYPSPNFGPAGLQVGNWRGQFPGQTGFTHFNDFGVRIDQNFSNGDKVYGRELPPASAHRARSGSSADRTERSDTRSPQCCHLQDASVFALRRQ